MVAASHKHKTVSDAKTVPYATPKYVPLRPSLAALAKKFIGFKVATVEETPRQRRRSPINSSPIAEEIDAIFRGIVAEGGLAPNELAFSIDTDDLENPLVKSLRKDVTGLKTSLLKHLKDRARAAGLPVSYIQTRQKSKILIVGPEA